MEKTNNFFSAENTIQELFLELYFKWRSSVIFLVNKSRVNRNVWIQD
jgi:hypothetical protein